MKTNAWPALGAARVLSAVALLALLSACGGGGSENAGTSPFPAPGGGAAPAPPLPPAPPASEPASPRPEGPSSSFARQCAPDNTLASSAERSASLRREQQWLRAFMDEAYLWPDEVRNVDPNSFRSGTPQQAMAAYFEALLSTTPTGSGQPRDRFSFTYPSAEWQALSQRGESLSLGVDWQVGSSLPPRNIRVAFVEPGSSAEAAGVLRGDRLLEVNGVSADASTAAEVERLNALLSPGSADGAFELRLRAVSGSEKTVRLTAARLQRNPVPLASTLALADGGLAGYLLFQDHVLPAEARLQAAMQRFAEQGIRELVIDLRYNSGGYLFLASQLAAMVSSPQQIAGRPFESLRFNARRSAENESNPFESRACLPGADFRCTSRAPLPQLGLRRVYVLSSSNTCSASESLINGLRGIDVEVVLIGSRTCGKPYGFTATDNCGLSYFPIEFEGRNAKGFGDYADGFEPGPPGGSGRIVGGCAQLDDFSRPLGDRNEALLATALHHASTGSCLPRQASSAVRKAQSAPDAVALRAPQNPARSNRFLLPR